MSFYRFIREYLLKVCVKNFNQNQLFILNNTKDF